MNKLNNFFKAIKLLRSKDPVKCCPTDKKEGCCHVDGMLCNTDTCEGMNK